MESIACGTPTVAFGIGGAVDYVRPGISGYLAEPENSDDLRTGIEQLLTDDALCTQMGQRAREMVLREYSLELEVQRYIELFETLIENAA